VQSTATAHRLFAARPRSGALFDVAVAVVALAGSLALLLHGGIRGSRSGSELDLLGGALAACAVVPLVAWRRSPSGVFLLTAAASTLAAGLGYALDVPFGPTAALYLLAASQDEANPWTRRTTAATVALLVAYLSATAAAEGALPATELSHTGLAWAAAWFAGERTRLRREHIAELEERAVRAERDTERERRLAAAEERARIARDLHDSAGHAISVIAVRAGAARLRHDEDPERSRRALEAIEQVARQTASEIDQIVGTLRDGGSPRGLVEDPPGLASLAALAERHATAGLEVTVGSAGEPRPLGGPVDQAAYRILQEALTNAARHGTGGARVELAFGETAFEVTVANPAAAARSARSSGGHGLVGMRERTTLLGGSFDAECVNGGFRVRVRLPYGAPSA
jgi:signal transduction histidine kinase